MLKESQFQRQLKKELQDRFPGCIILKNDSSYLQGIPDLLILYRNRWASLECKRTKNSTHRPNQDYYVNLMNDMSFSRFIFPENREIVLKELEDKFFGE